MILVAMLAGCSGNAALDLVVLSASARPHVLLLLVTQEQDGAWVEIVERTIEVPPAANSTSSARVDAGDITSREGNLRLDVSLDGEAPQRLEGFYSKRTGPASATASIGSRGTLVLRWMGV